MGARLRWALRPAGRLLSEAEQRALRHRRDEVPRWSSRHRASGPSGRAAARAPHRAEQDRERTAAGQLWQEGGWIFTSLTVEPINFRTDNVHWKALLKQAGVRDVRLHDARYTAATVLQVLGVPERAVMSLMGWSHRSMAARYQHLTATIRADVAARIGGLLWISNETGNGTTAGLTSDQDGR